MRPQPKANDEGMLGTLNLRVMHPNQMTDQNDDPQAEAPAKKYHKVDVSKLNRQQCLDMADEIGEMAAELHPQAVKLYDDLAARLAELDGGESAADWHDHNFYHAPEWIPSPEAW